MKYKIGDKVRIKSDISNCFDVCSDMKKWQGKIMTVQRITTGFLDRECYKMEEDSGDHFLGGTLGWNWHKDMIEGLAEPELTNTEILKLAISTYGEDEQIRMCHEEMDELGVAFSKYHRNPCKETLKNVQEEIGDVCIMMYQAKLMFGEKDVDAVIQQKIERLKENLEGEQEVEIVIGVHGLRMHDLRGKDYIWQNPKKHPVKVGYVVMADTKNGEQPIIVTAIGTGKKKDVKQHKCITKGVQE